jgi:Tfp pilus assembly protein PilO
MKSTFSTKGLLMGILVFTVVAIMGYYFLFQEIETRTTHTSDMQNQIEEATGREGYLLSLKAMLEDSKTDLSVLDTRLIAHEGTVAFLDRLESLSRFAGVKMSTDSLGVGAAGGEADTFLEQVGLSVSVDGSYSSVRYFLSLIETLPYSITIPSVSLERAGIGVGGGKSTWHGSFKITALIHK